MNKNFLPFSKPDINQAAIDEVVDSLKTGWLASGPKVKIFEQDLRNYLQNVWV
jgi:dTDP-4-amino-4,6-dideoxygalactose transaminase